MSTIFKLLLQFTWHKTVFLIANSVCPDKVKKIVRLGLSAVFFYLDKKLRNVYTIERIVRTSDQQLHERIEH